MSDASEAAPPIAYSPWWMVLGVGLIVLVIAWYGVLWWLTRKKKPRTIHTLAPLPPVVVDLAALKIKYLGLIAEIERQYQAKTISGRDVHQTLSITARLFVFEARGIRAHLLTLTDLRKGDQKALISLIEQYYPPEFTRLSQGNPPEAITKAKELVQSWS